MISFVHDLQTATAQPMSMISQYTCSILGSFGLAMYLSWKLTLVIMVGVPLMLVLVPIISSRVQPNLDAENHKRSEATKITANAFSGIETVKCFNGEQQEQQSYARAINDGAQFFNRQALWNALQSSVMRLVTLNMFVQGFWYGNVLLNQGDITASQILTAFWGAMLSVSLLMQITPYLVLLEKGKSAAHKLLVIIHQMERSVPVDVGECPVKVTGDIRFEGVSQVIPVLQVSR
jgi:ATP-binding cassette subfamily B (MDR/TAP) protein 1